ncbi:MAG: tandem-95 repeat protein [Gemmataceae bacterium]|nr:tandem-95 repeat protein [Gemmataceae bacterium]
MDWTFFLHCLRRRRDVSSPPLHVIRPPARLKSRSYRPGFERLEARDVPAIIVPPSNQPPNLAAIANQAMDESSQITIITRATDPDPGQTLTYTLVGAPAWASIGSGDGAIALAPGEAEGPGVYTFSVQVTDSGSPALSDQESVTVTVYEVNGTPVLGAVADRNVDEGGTLRFTVTATDTDVPANGLTYSLDAGAPAGAAIDAASGVFTFAPTEAQGPGVYAITVRVTDDGSPALSASQTFAVTVREVNAAPVLDPIADQTVAVGQTLSFTATASDPDLPANGLTFSLDGNAPVGASIGATSGMFAWTPTPDQAPGTFGVTVRVADDRNPNLFDEQIFTVTVSGPNQGPVAKDDEYVLVKNQTLTISLTSQGVLANDFDPEGDALRAEVAAQDAEPLLPAHGTLVFLPDGTFTYTPKQGYKGPDSFTYEVRDTNSGKTTLATVLLMVMDKARQEVEFTQGPGFDRGNNDTTGVVPGNSRYDYAVFFDSIPGGVDPQQVTGVKWLIDDPSGVATAGKESRWLHPTLANKQIGFGIDVDFANKPGVVILRAQYSIKMMENGKEIVKEFISKPFSIYVVQVDVKTPAAARPADQLTNAFDAGVAIKPGTPTDAATKLEPLIVDGEGFKSAPAKLILSGSGQQNANRTKFLSPGLEWRALVTLVGPTVNGKANTGVEYIHVGFIQHVDVVQMQGQYDSKPKQILINDVDSRKDVLDNNGNGQPFYTVSDTSTFFNATAEKNSKEIADQDEPRVGFHAEFAGGILDKVEIKLNFTLDVAARTTDDQPRNANDVRYFREATVNWVFNGSGTFDTSKANLPWTPSRDAQRIAVPNGWDATIRSPVQENIKGSTYNELITQNKFRSRKG